MNLICNKLASISIESYRVISSTFFHTSTQCLAWTKSDEPRAFMKYNKKVYPPQSLDEEPRPAFVCHQKTNFKYSPDKLWYIASFVRGMTVDEAMKQLNFINRKGARLVQEAILEAQENAVKNHNVEFKSNLWIAESFATKGHVIKGMRRHARCRMGEVRYIYSHYFIRLEEGKPPQDYYKFNLPTPQQQLENWLEGMRKRKIINSF